MYKFAFTYLVRQDKKSWNDFSTSLYLLNKNILSKIDCKFKILIFCEGEPSKKAVSLINALLKKSIKIVLRKISLQNYVKRKSSEKYKKYFPHVSDCTKTFSIGYRDMCKFFAFDIFKDKELKDSEYFIRLDTDSFFLDVRKKFIYNLQNIKADYGYIYTTIQLEDKSVSLGFGNCLYNFCKQKEIKNYLPKDYLHICQEATSNPKLFYTNFEVINLKWIKNNLHTELLKYIIKEKGIYNFRWGDSLIRYYSIKLIGADVLPLRGCLYKHQSIFDSRNFIKRIFSKIYFKINSKLHRDQFEIKTTKLDRFFLDIKKL